MAKYEQPNKRTLYEFSLAQLSLAELMRAKLGETSNRTDPYGFVLLLILKTNFGCNSRDFPLMHSPVENRHSDIRFLPLILTRIRPETKGSSSPPGWSYQWGLKSPDARRWAGDFSSGW